MEDGQSKRVYNLEERSAEFGEAIIDFCKEIPKNYITLPIINQLIRCGTSIGANYCEADCAESKRDFEHKLGICKKEAKEAKYWLRMVSRAAPGLAGRAEELSQEANELQLIFIAIIKKSRNNKSS
ncbi:MAG: four helix bundle protein [Patescibacteria group bacterium]